jgi:serpin B
MIIALPDEVDGLAEVSRRLDAGELTALLAALHAAPTRPVALDLPRFKTRFEADLKPLFVGLGMHRAFDRSQADFSGITGRPAAEGSFSIDAIMHRAMIDVMEDGTEAAAATAVVVVPTSAVVRPPPPPPEPFRVDHPFLFFVTDQATGAVLFEGRILDPTR